MNRTREKDVIRAADMLSEAKDLLQQCADDEQGAFDNLPDSLQMSERGERMEEMALELSAFADECDDLICNIHEGLSR